MNSKILSALHIAGDLLSDPSRRCIGTLAEDSHGFPINAADPKACKWCLTGALGYATNELGITDSYEETEVYSAMKEVTGIPNEYAAPVFWDSNEHLHDLIVARLRNAK